ncbi:hypothetical protein TWF718_008871 [Orbilia javanica]|uniref:Uncharacterized protein n=1 Tax=Orbilia javanica TaxID=47235 RepID=A0AAN8RM34_9PEZI
MNSASRKDDKHPINHQPHSQRPADQHSRFQSLAPQLIRSNQASASAPASASSSRFSSPASQGSNNTRFHNHPPTASPLPKEFRDKWRVVNTSSSAGNSNSERTTGIESSLYSPSTHTLKRKFEAVTVVGNQISRNWTVVRTSHAEPAPTVPGPGLANRITPNPPQLPIHRKFATTAPPVPPAPSRAPPLVSKGVSTPYQLPSRPKDRQTSNGNLNTPSITALRATQQTHNSFQETKTFRLNTPKQKDSWSATKRDCDGLINGLSEPSLLGGGHKSIMPFWPLPQDGYQDGSPAVSDSEKEEPSGLTGQSYPGYISQAEYSNSESESDRFEEYDPFDDVSELREALERREKTRSEGRLPISSDSQRRTPKRLSKAKPDESRRPYLSSEARSYFRDGNIPHLDSMIGHHIHVAFSDQEALKVWRTAYLMCISFAKEDFSIAVSIKALTGFLKSSEFSRNEKYEIISSIASEAVLDLPRREEGDVCRYIAEVVTACDGPQFRSQEIRVVPKDKPASGMSWSSLLLARQCAEDMWARGHHTSHAHVQTIGSRKALRFLQPFRTFTEGSSDVVDCAWDSSGRNFALACATYNDTYNRVGNLMLGSVDGPIKFLCGHKTRRPLNQGNNAILDPYLHSTVSSVDFSGDLLFSSGFDKTVKIWDKNDRLLRGSLAFEAPVVRLKMSGLFPNTGTVCLQNGRVVIFRSHLNSSDESDSRHFISARHAFLEPASISWVNGAAGRKGWVFVGYENQGSDKRQPNGHLGDLRLFDAEHGTEVQEIRPGSTRQFDINLDESGSLLITGAIVGTARGPTLDTHSYVRVYDIERSPRKTLEFGCQHKDINKVTMSPCRKYVTSSGTNGKSYLWDIRKGGDPLHEFGHGESRTPLSPDRDREEVDTGVTFASWAADGGLFATGSSDGIVKVWDPARADPFLYDLAMFDGPVMAGAFSPDGDCLMIGETTGKATLLSYMGRHGPPEPFVQDRTMLAPIASEV